MSNGEGTALQDPEAAVKCCWRPIASSKEVKPEAGQRVGEELELYPRRRRGQKALSRDIT